MKSNELFEAGGRRCVLYSKIARDSIIMFCLEKHSILKCEELLEKYKELAQLLMRSNYMG